MFISVIIPTYHRNDLLEKCLDRVAPGVQTLTAERYEIIVTDDGSETTAEELVKKRYPWVKWVKGPGKGPAANRNNGVMYAKGEWLVFTDDDCLPDPQWLEAYKKSIDLNSDSKVFSGSVYQDRPARSLAEYAPIIDSSHYLGTGNMCVQRQLFEQMDGFDERYEDAFEDVDFSHRLKKSGKSHLFCKGAAVCHPWRTNISIQDEWLRFEQFLQSLLLYLKIHPSEKKRHTSLYYLKDSFRNLIQNTIPGLIKYRCRGTRQVLLYHLYVLKIAWILLPNYFKEISEKNNNG